MKKPLFIWENKKCIRALEDYIEIFKPRIRHIPTEALKFEALCLASTNKELSEKALKSLRKENPDLPEGFLYTLDTYLIKNQIKIDNMCKLVGGSLSLNDLPKSMGFGLRHDGTDVTKQMAEYYQSQKDIIDRLVSYLGVFEENTKQSWLNTLSPWIYMIRMLDKLGISINYKSNNVLCKILKVSLYIIPIVIGIHGLCYPSFWSDKVAIWISQL